MKIAKCKSQSISGINGHLVILKYPLTFAFFGLHFAFCIEG